MNEENIDFSSSQTQRINDQSLNSLVNVLNRFDSASVAKAMNRMVRDGKVSPPSVLLVPAGLQDPSISDGTIFTPLIPSENVNISAPGIGTGNITTISNDNQTENGFDTETSNLLFVGQDENGIDGTTSITTQCGKDVIDYKYPAAGVTVKGFKVKNNGDASSGCALILVFNFINEGGNEKESGDITINPGKEYSQKKPLNKITRIRISCSGKSGSVCKFSHKLTII